MKEPNLPKRSWKVHAKAKGLSDPPAKLQQKKSTGEETVQRNVNRGSNGGDDEDDKIPDVVLNRMIVRILFYVGAPLATGLVLLQVFGLIKEQHWWNVPVWLPFLTTFLTFGASTVGIAYGTLSTSWNPDEKGSLLGIEEAQKNWVEMWKDDETNR
ncbi:hypothetical protein RJ639_030134 [Escallonia herrerae]|uniref:Uncharacterized protein n=1 Tax=Escallonia herrerae TaxID=1293975 RepID=A0AA88X055_9ASTE|nr:hypothetical protein RJ639_030134 [Escallonia herrerae]